MSNEAVHVPKGMIMAHVTDSPANIIATKFALPGHDPKTIDALHCKPSVDKDTQTSRHKDVKAKDGHNANLVWKREAYMSSDYAEYSTDVLSMLREFRAMWNNHL